MNIEYQLFVADAKKLARTLLIKSERSAKLINDYLELVYGEDAVDQTDPTSWKYYKNISGEYHVLDEDVKVVSWDTGETISFTKENLAVHTKTLAAYQYGTQQYKDLVTQYPRQETLIKGILYPANKADAIAADDHTILAYPSELVEENEYSLITKLNTWISGFKSRWYNQQFSISDDLNDATNQGLMFLGLVQAIICYRKEACKTNEAHSFHIKMYLMSHGIKGEVIRYLTKKQSLFLYRNIKYILRNTGKIETFDWLVEHIMTERFLPLSAYTLVHDDEKQVEDLHPTPLFRHDSLNGVYQSSVEPFISLDDLIEKEADAAPGNPDYIEDKLGEIRASSTNSLSNRGLTKVLESSVVDYEDTGQFSLETQLINYWLYFSWNGYYNNLVRIQNTKTGEYISLRVKDAYILAIYCFMKTIGIDLDFIPTMPAIRVPRFPTPPMSDLLSVCDMKYVDRSIIEAARNAQPNIVPFTSTTDFAANVVKLVDAAKYQKKLMALPEHHIARGMTEAAISRLYHDVECQLAEPNTSYTSWLDARLIKLDNFERIDYGLLYNSIVKDAIGRDFADENTLAGVHVAMIELLKQLSSYSIQFVRQFSGSELVSMNYIMTRLGDSWQSGESLDKLPFAFTEILDESASGSQRVNVDVTPVELRENLLSSASVKIALDVGLDITTSSPPFELEAKLHVTNVGLQSVTIE